MPNFSVQCCPVATSGLGDAHANSICAFSGLEDGDAARSAVRAARRRRIGLPHVPVPKNFLTWSATPIRTWDG